MNEGELDVEAVVEFKVSQAQVDVASQFVGLEAHTAL